jgi:sugar phosphate isomerase/epimerase
MLRRDCLKAGVAALLAQAGAKSATQNMSRFRPAICAYSFRNQLRDKAMSYDDVIRMAANLRCDGVDLTTYWLPDTTDQTLFALKRLAYRSAVSIYTIGIRARMVQPTTELQAAEAETVRKWVEVAEKIGAGHVRIFGGAVPKGVSQDQAVAWAVETLKRSAEEAAKRGITLGLEDDGGITTNADRTVEIVEKASSPWVGINLDIGNFPDNGYAQVEMCAPYATNVHFKSHVHVDHQSQPVDFARVLQILGKAGYRGYLALEYESTDSPMTAVPDLISKLQSAIAAYGS